MTCSFCTNDQSCLIRKWVFGFRQRAWPIGPVRRNVWQKGRRWNEMKTTQWLTSIGRHKSSIDSADRFKEGTKTHITPGVHESKTIEKNVFCPEPEHGSFSPVKQGPFLSLVHYWWLDARAWWAMLTTSKLMCVLPSGAHNDKSCFRCCTIPPSLAPPLALSPSKQTKRRHIWRRKVRRPFAEMKAN